MSVVVARRFRIRVFECIDRIYTRCCLQCCSANNATGWSTMSSSSARSTTRLSTRTGSSSSASSASAAASSPLARTGSIPKQRGEKYFIVLKAKGPEGAPRHCLFIVLARHDQLEPFVKGFSTSCCTGRSAPTGSFRSARASSTSSAAPSTARAPPEPWPSSSATSTSPA